MASLDAHLVDEVLGGLPVRRWVLTTPHRLRYTLGYDQRLFRRVLAVFIRSVLSFERRRARRRGIADGRGGAVTAIQRFGSAANLNVHFHSLVVQGVFAGDGARFVPLPAPSDQDVWRVVALVCRRVVRRPPGHGIDVEACEAAEQGRILQRRGDFYWNAAGTCELRSRADKRIPADRVAPDEYRQAVLAVLGTGHGFSRAELTPEARSVLGYRCTGVLLGEAIGAAIDQLRIDGQIGAASTGIRLRFGSTTPSSTAPWRSGVTAATSTSSPGARWTRRGSGW